MNCFEEIEFVIDYIEQNIDDWDMNHISKLTGIPGGLYQRIFSYVCGISISEYVRKRRITEAARKYCRVEAVLSISQWNMAIPLIRRLHERLRSNSVFRRQALQAIYFRHRHISVFPFRVMKPIIL